MSQLPPSRPRRLRITVQGAAPQDVQELRTFRVRIPFGRVQEKLAGSPFLLVNRGVLLNMDHILRTRDNGFVMDSGAFFTGRCRSYRSTRRAYEDYLLGRAGHTRA